MSSIAASVMEEINADSPYDITSSRRIRVSQCELRPISGRPISGSPSQAASSLHPKYALAIACVRLVDLKWYTRSVAPSASYTCSSCSKCFALPSEARAFAKKAWLKPIAWIISWRMKPR